MQYIISYIKCILQTGANIVFFTIKDIKCNISNIYYQMRQILQNQLFSSIINVLKRLNGPILSYH